MKPLVGIYEFLPQPGGGQRVAALIASTLSKDFDVGLLSNRPIGIDWWAKTFGVDMSGVRSGMLGVQGYGGKIAAVMNEPIDILISAEYAYWALDPGKAKRKYIIAHDAHPLGNTPDFLPQYDMALPSSEYGKSKLTDEKWPIPSKVMYPPVFEEGHLKKSAKIKRILYVARFDHHRNNNSLPTVLEAWRDMYDSGFHGYELAFAGWVQNRESFERLKERARGYPISFYPSPSTEDLFNLYRTSMFTANFRGIDSKLPSTAFSHEALGMVTIESIFNGTIPIVHDFGGHKETVVEPRLRVADLEHLSERWKVIIRQFEDPALYAQTIDLLYEDIRKKFSRESYLKAFHELIAI